MIKMRNIIASLLLIGCSFAAINTYEAKTLGQLKSELATLEKKHAENEANEKRTEAEIQASQDKIKQSQDKINKARNQIQQAEEDIKELNKEIEAKKEETQELIRFLQIANGENTYLEYIFGASSMADLINRLAIVEQISNYNDEVIEEMNKLIDKNVKLQAKLEKQKESFEEKIVELKAAIKELYGELDDMGDVAITVEAQIKAKKEQIDHYTKIGCKDDQDITQCVKIPTATGFVRPLTYGIVSSEFGWRTYWLNGEYVTDYHRGIDLATGDEGYKVYAAAPGTVSAVFKKQYCGGNMVYIDHLINGVEYSTAYFHLLKVNVKVGDTVFQDSVIGTVGGGPKTWGWDSCSSGAHLHFGISKTHYREYSSWNKKAIDPEKKIKFPSGWFNRRY